MCLQAWFVFLESARRQQTRADRGSVWVGELLQEEGSWLCVLVNDSKPPKQLSCEITHVAIVFCLFFFWLKLWISSCFVFVR